MKTIKAAELKAGDIWRWRDEYRLCLLLSTVIVPRAYHERGATGTPRTAYIIWSPHARVTRIEFGEKAVVVRM